MPDTRQLAGIQIDNTDFVFFAHVHEQAVGGTVDDHRLQLSRRNIDSPDDGIVGKRNQADVGVALMRLHTSVADVENAARSIRDAGIRLRLERNDFLDLEGFRVDNLDVRIARIRYKQFLTVVRQYYLVRSPRDRLY